MQTKNDRYSICSGQIRWNDSRGNWIRQPNTVTYRAADLLAALIAGDNNARPSHIGFLYGGTANPTGVVDPKTLPSSVRRHWQMSELEALCVDNELNVSVAPLAQRPSTTLMEASDPERYTENTVTFSAHTGMVDSPLFSGVDVADALEDLSPAYVYQVLLLSKQLSGDFDIFAIAQLGSAPFVAKVTSRHQAVFWNITFN